MKRPGGFDREAESRHEPVAKVPEGAFERPGAPEAAEAAEAAEAHEVPARAPGSAGLAGSAAASAASRSDAFAETQPLSDVVDTLRPGQGVIEAFKQKRADPVKAAERRVRDAERQTKRRSRRESRRFTAVARRSKRKLWIIGGAVLSLMLFVVLVVFTPLMAVTEVKVEGAETVNVADLEVALERFDGVPLALVDENEVLRALEAFPLIQRFAVERVPPHTLLVRVEERTAVIAVEQDGAFLLYDAAGVLIGNVPERPAGVPLGVDTAQQTSTQAFSEAAQVIRDLPAELRAQVVSVSAKTGQDVTLTLDSGVEVFWGNTEKTKRKAVVLQAMLTSLAGRPVTHIDVSSSEAPVFR